jgi:serine/threonine protein kinase
MSVLSFDFGVMSGLFCIVNMSFYANLLSSTMLLVAVVVAIFVRACFMRRRMINAKRAQKIWQDGLFVAMYVLLFAYPVVSIRVVETFACHEVEGVRYLRADYSIQCDTPEWYAYAIYSGVWIAGFVLSFPTFVLWKLYSYRRNPNDPAHVLGFLADDFKAAMPALLWEGVEMIRKLLLSVMGTFWSSQSTMCIATALLVSSIFLVLHHHFQPYKSTALNRMQSLALTVLTLFYFVGILFKTESIEASDQEDLGVLMALLMFLTLTAVVLTVVSEVRAVMQWAHEIKYARAKTEENQDFNASLKDHIIAVDELTMGIVLGQGAEGMVRKATYAGTKVAVKITSLSMICTRPLNEQLQEAQAEAQMLQPLRHPNIVVFYGVAIEYASVEVKVMTVLELCAHGSLDDYLLDKKIADISWKKKLELCSGVAKGMAYLHAKGIMHRDLKTLNVLLDEKNTPKIADFGLSKHRDKAQNEVQSEQTANVGTPIYMAPELMTDEEVATCDISMVDVYAFGILMWAVLTRTKPYDKVCKARRLNIWALVSCLYFCPRPLLTPPPPPPKIVDLTFCSSRVLPLPQRELVLSGSRPDIDDDGVLDDAPTRAVMLMCQCWAPDPKFRPSGFDEVDQRLRAVLGGVEAAAEEVDVCHANSMNGEGAERQVAAGDTGQILPIQAYANPMLTTDGWIAGRASPSDGNAGLAAGFNSMPESGEGDEQQENGVLPITSNPVHNRKRAATSTTTGEVRAVL